MKRLDFNHGWTCQPLSRAGEALSVTLPHDAMRTEKRTPDSAGKVIQILENKRKEGLGFSPTSTVSKGTFYSAGFINAIAEDAAERGHVPTFVIPGGTVRNWEAVDVPLVMHASM